MNSICWGIAALLLVSNFANAADGGRLGGELTTNGAEREGNKEGSIPAFNALSPFSVPWKVGQRRDEPFRYKDDKVLFSIDASNVDKYADKLWPGIVAHLKQSKTHRMDVYPTRRTCMVPEFVAENMKKNVSAAKLGEDGWTLAEAVLPGAPFPMPTTGEQVLWNTKMRYRGVAIHFPRVLGAVSPRPGGEEWIKAVAGMTYFFPWGAKGSAHLSTLPKLEYQVYFNYEAPVALAGQAMVLNVSVDKPGSEAFYYFPGQRRVRRMPSYAYDAPQIGYESQYLIDEPQIFTGTIDRYNWKIVGKKEMYIPYNAFGVYDWRNKDAGLQATGLDPNLRRYELHRVWVIDGTLKSGSRHVSTRKTIYVDEDSWNAVAAEDYDNQGKLWKAREAFPIPVAEIGACDAPAAVQYNLYAGRYVADTAGIGMGKDFEWVTEAKGPREKASFYTADNLRAISER